MRIAILSAALNGDNSGDSIIETAVRRLVQFNSIKSFPLTYPLTEQDIDDINTYDKLLICGTNLYQHVFACNLTEDIVYKIRIPIIPFGIGSSAPIGKIPIMREADIRTVKAIHKTCVMSSVRDMASYQFLKSIGVDNVLLTGCPVLFHGLKCPEFTLAGNGYTLTPRARLLHIEDTWEKRQLETLEILSEKYKPTLVLQSPYDIPCAKELAKKYNLPILQDEKWQADKYIELAKSQYINMGFRLHFAMLSISYGKPAFLISHDSRASEFCSLINIPLINIKSYSDNLLDLQIGSCAFNSSEVKKRWDELSLIMYEFISRNGLESNLCLNPTKSKYIPPNITHKKPSVLLLIDKRNWAFDHSAKNIAQQLKNDFDFDFAYVTENPKLDSSKYDLLYVFFWGETYYQKFGFKKEQIIKELSSHRWEDNSLYGPCTPEELVDKYLNDASAVICTSKKLQKIIKDIHPNVLYTPNGFNYKTFKNLENRKGEIIIGWAGNINDSVKGFIEYIKPACVQLDISLLNATGNLNHKKMNEFYNKIDVFAVSSRNEGEPLTLVEAMAAGCFPVCSDVGIVRELITDGINGIIVKERSVESYAKAFSWCAENIEYVRKKGAENALFMLREREWHITSFFFKYAFLQTIRQTIRQNFRNDDVSFDTNIQEFKRFCNLFTQKGFDQMHGITLNGNTNTLFLHNNKPVEYENVDNISTLPYETIVHLSKSKKFSDRKDIISFINQSQDSVALHGLYHTDYSRMSEQQQMEDITEGLTELQLLFPNKKIKYFIPPFNRSNSATYVVCKKLGLTVLASEGVHLEEVIAEGRLSIPDGKTWYRYHHHRFYPETTFSYYQLSMDLLEKALFDFNNSSLYDWGIDYRYFDSTYQLLSKKIIKENLADKIKSKVKKLIYKF